jgi:RHS repeat-associated protein
MKRSNLFVKGYNMCCCIIALLIVNNLGVNAQQYNRIVSSKSYELTNHLGNVTTTVSDRKLYTPSPTGNTIAQTDPDITTTNDYYPYGMLLAGRSEAAHYRFGFQGQERDDEVKGEGNSVNYTYRMHDVRLGRFFAVDPLSAKYAYNSTYAFSENQVIAFIELEGAEKKKPPSKKKYDCVPHVAKEKKIIQNLREYAVKKILFQITPDGGYTWYTSDDRIFPSLDHTLTVGANGGTVIMDGGKDISDEFTILDQNGVELFKGEAGGLDNPLTITTTLPQGRYEILINPDPDNTMPGQSSSSSITYEPNGTTLYLLVEKVKFLGITIAKRRRLSESDPRRGEKLAENPGIEGGLKSFRKRKIEIRKRNRLLMKKHDLTKRDLRRNRIKISSND